jgi:hypothetical protein
MDVVDRALAQAEVESDRLLSFASSDSRSDLSNVICRETADAMPLSTRLRTSALVDAVVDVLVLRADAEVVVPEAARVVAQMHDHLAVDGIPAVDHRHDPAMHSNAPTASRCHDSPSAVAVVVLVSLVLATRRRQRRHDSTSSVQSGSSVSSSVGIVPNGPAGWTAMTDSDFVTDEAVQAFVSAADDRTLKREAKARGLTPIASTVNMQKPRSESRCLRPDRGFIHSIRRSLTEPEGTPPSR